MYWTPTVSLGLLWSYSIYKWLLSPYCIPGFTRVLFNLQVFTEPLLYTWFQFSSVAPSCPTLCDPMNCSTPGLLTHHQLPEFTQTHVHWVGDAIQPSHPLSSPFPPPPNPSQHQGLFQWVNSSHEVAKVLELLWSYSIYKCLLSPCCIPGFTLVLFSLQTFTETLLYRRRKWQPTPVFLPGESHGRRSLVGYSPWGLKGLDTTERLHFHFLLYPWVYSGPIQSTSVYWAPIVYQGLPWSHPVYKCSLSTCCIPGSTVVSSQQIPYLILNFSVLMRISSMLLLISLKLFLGQS